MTWHFTTLDGLRLAIETDGHRDNPAVVLLHGGGQTRHAWANTSRHLALEGYFAVRYDARGHGDSDWAQTGDYSLSAFIGDLRSILGQLQRPVALVGASLGGLTAIGAAGLEDPADISSLLIVDVALRPQKSGVDRIRKFMSANPDGFANIDDAIDAVASYHGHRSRTRNSTGMQKNLRRGADDRFRWHWDPRFLETDMIHRPDEIATILARLASNILAPTLLLRGEHSDIVSDEAVAELSKLIPAMDVHTVPGAGHMVASDKNDCFNQQITAYLRQRFPGGKRVQQSLPLRAFARPEDEKN